MIDALIVTAMLASSLLMSAAMKYLVDDEIWRKELERKCRKR